MNEPFEGLVGRIILGHSRDCTLGRSDNDEGDFCSCKLRQRKQELREIIGRGTTMSGLRKIGEVKEACVSPEHNPPAHIVLDAGVYEYVCPACGYKQVFTVQAVTN